MGNKNFRYVRVYNRIKEDISKETYKVGEKLPTDEELTELLGVSLITIKKALGLLKEEGVVQRISGVGTFVLSKDSKQQNDLPGKVPEERASEEKTESKATHSKQKSTVPTVGVILEHATSNYGLDMLYRLDHELAEQGYKMNVRFSYYNREKETEEIDYLLESKVDGIIIMPCHGTYYNTKILKLIFDKFPVVLIDKKLEGISVPTVRTDNRQAVKKLVKELYEKGCRRIAYFSPEAVGTSSLQERKDGYLDGIRELSLPIMPVCSITFDEDIFKHKPLDTNIDRAREYLTQVKDTLDGIICSEYSILPDIKEAVKSIGADFDKRVKIGCVDGERNVGFEYIFMKQDEISIAEKAVEILMNQIKGMDYQGEYLVKALLVEEK